MVAEEQGDVVSSVQMLTEPGPIRQFGQFGQSCASCNSLVDEVTRYGTGWTTTVRLLAGTGIVCFVTQPTLSLGSIQSVLGRKHDDDLSSPSTAQGTKPLNFTSTSPCHPWFGDLVVWHRAMCNQMQFKGSALLQCLMFLII